MTKINFVKMSGAGNDFIIIDNRKENYQLDNSKIIKICERKNIGCDQLIVLKNSSKADILMDIYNSDGSKSGACGNASRCIAGIIMNEKNLSEVNIETASVTLKCKKEGDLISVNMGRPEFDWHKIPLREELDTNSFNLDLTAYEFSAVNMGNPHLITFINNELSDEEFFRIGPKLEHHNLFTQKTNVEFARIISSNHIKIRVWERGTGETLACGSGACAVAVTAIKKGLVKREKIKTSFKGGDLFIEWQKNNDVIMTGDYKNIFSGIIDEKFIG